MATQNSIDNTSNPLATTAATIDPGASGDSYIQFDINGTGEFRVGVDDDASDAFKISQGSALGTSDTFIMSASGECTLPLQPAFRAYVSSTITNVTGDSTGYDIVYDTEDFDTGSDFNTTTGTFTAPVAGKYVFTASMRLSGLTTSQINCPCGIRTGGTNEGAFMQWNMASGVDVAGALTLSGQLVFELAASDTVTVIARCIGGSKVVDILADSYFSGFLCC